MAATAITKRDLKHGKRLLKQALLHAARKKPDGHCLGAADIGRAHRLGGTSASAISRRSSSAKRPTDGLRCSSSRMFRPAGRIASVPRARRRYQANKLRSAAQSPNCATGIGASNPGARTRIATRDLPSSWRIRGSACPRRHESALPTMGPVRWPDPCLPVSHALHPRGAAGEFPCASTDATGVPFHGSFSDPVPQRRGLHSNPAAPAPDAIGSATM